MQAQVYTTLADAMNAAKESKEQKPEQPVVPVVWPDGVYTLAPTLWWHILN